MAYLKIMKNILFQGYIFLLLCMGSCTDKDVDPPNIIFVLADDLGYGEVGYQNQTKINTPNIDRLASSGMIFTNHYTGAPVCAPARSIFLTGMHGGHTYIRGNDEWAERGEVWNYAKATKNPELEGQRPLPKETLTLATKKHATERT